MNQLLILKHGEEWTVQPDGDVPMLVVKTINGHRTPSVEELERAMHFLNEATSFSATIYCRNEKCKDVGSWIRRSTEDLKRNTYACETCQQPMVR